MLEWIYDVVPWLVYFEGFDRRKPAVRTTHLKIQYVSLLDYCTFSVDILI